ncbi:MAG: hypothetical protein ACUVQ3_06265 [bacterium]
MNRNIFSIIFFLFLSINLSAVEIDPPNIFIYHYELIPPLGEIKSIATSVNKIFALSDNYLLIFDKSNLRLIRTAHFNQDIFLIAYDQFYDELWITGANAIFRYNIHLGSIREYQFVEKIDGIGIAPEKVYISARKKYALDRLSGVLESVPNFPANIIWYRGFDDKVLKDFKFLSPYYYRDDLNETNEPFHQYNITALYDEGLYLYVGTDKYGLLRYNKVSLERQRIIYGPLTTTGQRLKKIGNTYYFISAYGISNYNSDADKSWRYFRLSVQPEDLVFFDNELIVSYGNQLIKVIGNVTIPIAQFRNKILNISFDDLSIYVGTDNGMYRILKETNEPLDFGPDRYPVYVIYPFGEQLYVGGEFATYLYDRIVHKWKSLINRGTKDICEINSMLYFLTTDNQLIQYGSGYDSVSSENDTLPIILPYFNIYDIDTDGKALYCATASGINYFDPERNLYNPVYNLPRIKYNYVAITEDDIIAVADQKIYRLPLKYRD